MKVGRHRGRRLGQKAQAQGKGSGQDHGGPDKEGGRNGHDGYKQKSGNRDSANKARIPEMVPLWALALAAGSGGRQWEKEVIPHGAVRSTAMEGAETTAGSVGGPGGGWVQRPRYQRTQSAQPG